VQKSDKQENKLKSKNGGIQINRSIKKDNLNVKNLNKIENSSNDKHSNGIEEIIFNI